jgi:hypothetical protein
LDDTPLKSGRCGDWVFYLWNGQQWRRRWFKPYDPKTPKQVYWRARLAAASRAYNEALTDEERHACIAAGARRWTRPRLGQSGQQTGQQYWVGKQSKQQPAPAPKARKPKS